MLLKKAGIILMILFIGLSSCDKDSPTQKTSLEITVTNEDGSVAYLAGVDLFESQSDWENGTNAVTATKLTDAYGKVIFSDLKPKVYYITAADGCKNNRYALITNTQSAINANAMNYKSTILSGTGTLRFVNNSSVLYYVSANDIILDEPIEAHHIFEYHVAPGGFYTIEIINGSTWEEDTYTGNLACGGTLTTTIP